MKPILRGVTFTAAILSLAFGSGCRGQKAHADEIPTVSNPAPVTVAAPAPAVVVVPAAPATPAPTPAVAAAAPVTTSVPPGSIIITNPTPAVPSAPAAQVIGSAEPIPADTNVVLEAMPPVELDLTPALTDVVKLVQGGVTEDVLMAYITNSPSYFNMGSAEILYLHDLGVPTNIITTLIAQDATPQAIAAKKTASAVKPLPSGVALTVPATNVYPPTATDAPPSTTPGTQAPAVVYTVPAATQPVTVNYFYNELAPYGTWIDVPGYGHCWRPTVAVWNRGWRPYADGGRWLWTDSGWYWYSDYSWGWAPFHYGRWTTHGNYGWVWVPDVHWGPAWVSWRSSSSYCGWAPLPPSARWAGHGFRHHSLSVGVSFEFGLSDFHYVYLPFNRFCDRRPSQYYIASHRAREIHRETTVVNNYVTVNNTVVNRGVGYDRVAAVNRDSIRRVSLRPTSEAPRGGSRREVLDNDGRALTVARPVNSGFVSGNTAAPRSASSPSVRPPSGGRSATVSTPATPREITPTSPATPRSETPRGPRPSPTVVRGGTRSPADVAPVTTTPSTTPRSVTTPATAGGRSVPAAPTSPGAEAPRGGRPTVRPNNNQTQVRIAPESRPSVTPAAPVVRVPPSTPRADAAPRVYVQPQPSRSEAPRFNAPNPSFNNAPRTPSYSAPAPTPRVETPRAPSPAPSVQRSAPAPSSPRPAPSQAPSRSGGDGGSRTGRSSGEDNGRRNSR
ncbi:MAG: hypothetical protein IPK15_09245 [Verrucomicrobia bacterium]|nr:hypothetical protein [Verrucomicrobiota bacterium]